MKINIQRGFAPSLPVCVGSRKTTVTVPFVNEIENATRQVYNVLESLLFSTDTIDILFKTDVQDDHSFNRVAGVVAARLTILSTVWFCGYERQDDGDLFARLRVKVVRSLVLPE